MLYCGNSGALASYSHKCSLTFECPKILIEENKKQSSTSGFKVPLEIKIHTLDTWIFQPAAILLTSQS